MKDTKWFLQIVISFTVGAAFFLVIFYLAKDKKDLNNFLSKPNDQAAAEEVSVNHINDVSKITRDDFLWGNLASKVQLIVYMDFDCLFSAQFRQTLNQIRSAYGDRVAIAIRDFPLDSHPNAPLAAQAFECARDQDKGEAMYNALFDNQGQNDNNTDSLVALADKLGLDQDKFKDCLTTSKYQAKVMQAKADGKASGVNGTPTSFLNGRNIPGAYQFDDFTDSTGRKYDGLKTLIDKELNK